MSITELESYLKRFENMREEFHHATIALEKRIVELNHSYGFYEDGAIQTEKDDLILQLSSNEREINQLAMIISILNQSILLLKDKSSKELNVDANYRLLMHKLSSETFNPEYSRQVDLDQKAATIFDAGNALEALQLKHQSLPA